MFNQSNDKYNLEHIFKYENTLCSILTEKEPWDAKQNSHYCVFSVACICDDTDTGDNS